MGALAAQRARTLEKKRERRRRREEKRAHRRALGHEGHAIPFPPMGRPMSEVLGEFAMPLLEPMAGRTLDDAEAEIQFAVRIWNTVVTAQREGSPREIDRLRRELATDAPGLLERALSLCERKVLRYAGDLRRVESIYLSEEEPGGIDLIVLSESTHLAPGLRLPA